MAVLLREEVDIYVKPEIHDTELDGKLAEVTVGDLHGNMIKLLYFLVRYGIANISPDNYEKLVRIYQTPLEDIDKECLVQFNTILDNITFQRGRMIRLLGDELADRGANDYFTLKLLEKLQLNKVPVEILLSNHSVEFIESYEKEDRFHTTMVPYEGICHSIESLQRLVDKKVISREEVLELANVGYKPALRAISYSLNEDLSEITIYSHAGIGLETIESLAKKLDVPYLDSSAKELASTIDNINRVFQGYASTNTVNTLYSRETMTAAYKCNNEFVIESPIEFLMMNRNYSVLNRPVTHSGYRINFVHGHEISDLTKENIYNLDDDLGKSSDPIHAPKNRGVYSAVMHVVPPSIAPRLLFDVRQSLQEESFDDVDKLYKSTFNPRLSLFKPQPILVAEEELLSLEKTFDAVDKLYEPIFNPELSLFKPKSILVAEEEPLTWEKLFPN
ncbi:Dot/Icm T4SS effector Wip [Legionella cincinnatiensis]|uniref:Dot/Icm secretion system substrate n=1 Tax=Legionella cincinnatiensis TaxID=28085 RepID=A0A378INZ4_9GAMM|nr:Dot/Icm T4SS effector Wip [Legionella cincinnatiensis]KTC92356.1 putative Dot/Icm substrate WipB [Legionella cincinnatiensis]STX36763.1 Dot/Icm secretion system substrate [Legionella cincinnatiensis]